MSFGFKHELFSFVLMILFAFDAKIQLFLSVFQTNGKEQQNHSSAPHPLFHAF
jgi:hypothetical protein